MDKKYTYETAKRNFFKSLKKTIAVEIVYSNFDYKDQKRLIRELPERFNEFFYIKDPLPNSLSLFVKKVQFVPDGFMSGLGCLVNQLLPYRKELNEYVKLKNDYENCFLRGELDQCQVILDSINKISLSLWSLEQMIQLAYRSGGSKNAIACKDSIAAQTTTLVAILLQLIWTKVEARYSLSPTEQQLYLTINEAEFSDSFSAYYKYFILKDRTCYRFEDGVWFVLMTSVIDIYNYVLDAITFKAQTLTAAEAAQIRSMLADLGKQINDERIIALNYRLGFSNQGVTNQDHESMLDMYSKGDYQGVYDKALPYIIDNPTDFDIIDVYVKSAVFLQIDTINTRGVDKESFLGQILGNFFKYLKKGDNSVVSLGRLKVIANQMSSFKTGNCLSERIKYNEIIDYGLFTYSLYVGYKQYSSEDCYEGDCQAIVKNGELPVFVKQKVVSRWFRKLVDERKDYEAISFYLSAFFNNVNNVRLVDAEKLLKRHNQLLQFLDYPPLETSVFYALTGAPLYMYYHFFKKFINGQKIKTPSELIDVLTDDFSPLLELFFYRVCSLESIKNYIRLFPDSDAALNERLSILTKLSVMHRREEYLDEMTLIKRKLNAKQRVKILDQRMIYVDETALKETELREVRRQFKIYKETESTIETQQFLLEANKVDSAAMLVEGDMRFKTERVKYKNLLFRQMFFEIRKQFLTSYNYGLDFYLSTRIRHGTFVRQMRRAFEDNNLITNKYEGEYKLDSVVSERVLGLSQPQKEQVQGLLKKFSNEIDDYIYFLKNEVVQVQARDLQIQHPNAIFNFDRLNTETDIAELYLEKICKITDYVEFVEEVFAYLWSCTETQLVEMREYLDQVQLVLDKKLDDLMDDIKQVVGNNNRLSELFEIANRAKEEMAQSIDKVKLWFYRGQCDDDDFVVRDVLDACKESVSIHRGVNFDVEFQGECVEVLKGECFRKMSDLILILFNNIIDYSEKTGEPAKSVVNVECDHDIVKITVLNRLRECDVDDRKKLVCETQKKFQQLDYLKNSSKDKGFGLVKAFNMVQNMMPSDENAFVLDVVNGHFVASFRIDIKYWRSYENTCC